MVHGYYACISYVDAQIGRILQTLDDLGMRENTVVILWGDHGYKLGEYGYWGKYTNFELDTLSPMIISAPGMAQGHRCNALAELVDIYPTIVDLCGFRVPRHCQGVSLTPLLMNPNGPGKTVAYSQCPRFTVVPRIMGYSIRTERWRYNEWKNMETGEIVDRELYDQFSGAFAYDNLADEPVYAELTRLLSTLIPSGRPQPKLYLPQIQVS
jgi:iduronate 2-sulfatase